MYAIQEKSFRYFEAVTMSDGNIISHYIILHYMIFETLGKIFTRLTNE